MIARTRLVAKVRRRLETTPAVALLGPRQCGKTTLARVISAGDPTFNPDLNYFDLERATDLARLEAAEVVLSGLRGLVVIDEIQRRPELFLTLRHLIDRPSNPLRFLLLGSASRVLLQQSADSFAGRIALLEMGPLRLDEVGAQHWRDLWKRGGFPRSFLAPTELDSREWRDDYISALSEVDLRMLGLNLPPPSMRRLLILFAHAHGGHLNLTQLGSAFGVSAETLRRYTDFLSAACVIRQVQPWFENLGKRQVKAPKIYVRDTGLLHSLLQIPSRAQLEGHPAVGHSWEAFALEQVCSVLDLRSDDVSFWGVHGQAEIDLVTHIEGQRVGFEFKYGDAPRLSRSMVMAAQALGLSQVLVIYPGGVQYTLHDAIRAMPLQDVSLQAVLDRPQGQ